MKRLPDEKIYSPDQGRFTFDRPVRAFALCIFAQSFAGWRLQNETLAAHGKAKVGYWHNLSTGTSLDGLATNWQAAFPQLASLIVFSGFLCQRGAPHCRDPLKPKNKQ